MSRYEKIVKFETELNRFFNGFYWDDAWDRLYRNDDIEPLKKSVAELESIILRMNEKIKEVDK